MVKKESLVSGEYPAIFTAQDTPFKASSMLIKKIIWWVSLPLFLLLIPQAIYVKRTTLRLPEADGERAHQPQNAQLNMLHAGESTVAGVGVQNLKQGLTAQLANQIKDHSNKEVAWHIYGVNGIKIKELNIVLEQCCPKKHYQFAIITLGVNDTTKLTSLKNWHHQLKNLVRIVQKESEIPVIFTQVPPMAQFPALPAPLKYFLGLRSHLLDLELQRFCHHTKDVFYVGSELEVAREMMAEDGYHPSALGYENWAARLLPDITQILNEQKSG